MVKPSHLVRDHQERDVLHVQHNLFHALAAVSQLHPKQLLLLQYLNHQRSPHQPDQTIPLSYAHLSGATGITTEHIRRNGLHRLFSSGLLSVIQKGLNGTVYRLHYGETILCQIFERNTPPKTILKDDSSSARPQPPLAQMESHEIEKKLANIELLRISQQHLLREEFEATLHPDQRRWLAYQAKTIIDQQEGMRFIQDRFSHYEKERARLLDEWRARQQYGEQVPPLALVGIQEGDH